LKILLTGYQKRAPRFLCGNGIRISGGFEAFKSVIEKLNIPVVTGWNSIDCIYDEHPLYTAGRHNG
jgi:acetolactate synthase-1/2/3 large subunit